METHRVMLAQTVAPVNIAAVVVLAVCAKSQKRKVLIVSTHHLPQVYNAKRSPKKVQAVPEMLPAEDIAGSTANNTLIRSFRFDPDGRKPGKPYRSADAAAAAFGRQYIGVERKRVEWSSLIYSYEYNGSTVYTYTPPETHNHDQHSPPPPELMAKYNYMLMRILTGKLIFIRILVEDMLPLVISDLRAMRR